MVINIGKNERHEVEFTYDTTWGKVKIKVDNKQVQLSRVITLGQFPFNLEVGEHEKHKVKFELYNPRDFAIKGSKVSAYVDKKKVKEEEIKPNLIMFVLLIAILAVIGIALVLKSLHIF